MYLSHFGLREPPFSITPDPRFLYMSARHREALAHLVYGVGEHGGFVQLSGEVGTGKTSVCRCLLEQLPPHVDVALVLNPRLSPVELLATVCDELRIPYPGRDRERRRSSWTGSTAISSTPTAAAAARFSSSTRRRTSRPRCWRRCASSRTSRRRARSSSR